MRFAGLVSHELRIDASKERRMERELGTSSNALPGEVAAPMAAARDGRDTARSVQVVHVRLNSSELLTKLAVCGLKKPSNQSHGLSSQKNT